jgi:hypothetical protein
MSRVKQLFIGVLLVFFVGISSVFGQVERIEQAIEDGNYRRALKIALDSEEDKEFKKDPEVYFMKAEIILELMKDEFYLRKNPESLKIGFKALEKGKRKNEGFIFSAYDEVVDGYIKLNNELAATAYKVNKYLKAAQIYQKSYNLNGDLYSYFWVGKTTIMSGDTALGETYYTNVVDLSIASKDSNTAVEPEFVDAFIHYADKYWLKNDYDSANIYLNQGRRIFGKNPRLDYYTTEIAKQQIDNIPPSNLMMEKIKTTLAIFPTDTFFIQKENALYLYLLRNHLKNDDLQAFDTMLKEFVTQKVERQKSEFLMAYKQYDQFTDSKEENVLWKLISYYSKFDHIDASNFLVDRYIRQTANSDSEEDIKNRYVVIADYAAKSKSLALATQILQNASKIYGESSQISGIRKSLISKNSDKELETQDLGGLYTLLMAENSDLSAVDEDLQIQIVKYIDALVKDKLYVAAKSVVSKHYQAQPDNPIWIQKLKFIAKEDFYYSYYMTKIREEVVAGMKIPGFEWNGDAYNCDAGVIDADVHQKVEDRINYFRRQSGLGSVYLDRELNTWCQEAALVMESNKRLNHEITPKWSCFTDEAAEAAKYSLLTEGANTTLAVTSFFADNRNPSVGNRRWLLYPNGLALGHGSTDNYCVLWALDDSGNVDSNVYKDQFVAWPPEGHIPKMMAFKHWSFSIDQDIEGASVVVRENGSMIPLKIMPTFEGYGMPTVAWVPEVSFANMKEDRIFTVEVTLRNGRKYVYTVNIMNFEAEGY